MDAESEAREAVRVYRRVEVYVRNAIRQGMVLGSKADWEQFGGAGFTQTFEDLDEALRFAEEHRLFFNNCIVEVSYVTGYEVEPTTVPASPCPWDVTMVPAERTLSVWRDVPGWESGEPDRRRYEHVHRLDGGTYR
ncbi:hypothetical protein C8D87_114125 [Lentzea atacamensis]|uniref:Uncharacterized protein n=1 Tax=Lentzea atacamensis TaxID=531938 RepID=A0ABX9DW43_9PSEU|nr:hypothetical protein [Lentzea atacamensis]RAS59513.1 hypothetical protein C8D87_114125 [Lentzea atacamensis]